MVRKISLCPCVECEHNPFVTKAMWRTHAAEIGRGTRARGVCLPTNELFPSGPAQAPAEEEEMEQDTTAEHYSAELTELVADGKVGVTGAECILKATHKNYTRHLAKGVTVPPSWFIAKNLATKGKTAQWFTRDFCPKCDHLFQTDKKDVHCPRCDKDTRYRPHKKKRKPARQAYYFSMEDKCKRLFAQKILAAATLPATDDAKPRTPIHNRDLNGPFDGSILESLHHECDASCGKNTCLYFALSNDGVEVEKNVAYTPITAKLLNLPPEMRGLLTCIWLLGYMPPKVKDYQAMLQPVLDMIAEHAPDSEWGTPCAVHSVATGATEDLWFKLAWTVNDIRAVPGVTCGTAPPAYVGSCNMCAQMGLRPHKLGTTVLPGAVRALGEGDEEDALRKAYAKEFAAEKRMAEWAGEGPPPKRTKQSAIASGNRVLSGQSKKKEEAFYDVDIFTQSLWYHDKIKHTLYDNAHEFTNVIKQTFNFMMDKNKKNKKWFTTARRAFENNSMKRFPHLRPVVTCERVKGQKKLVTRYPRAGWVASKESISIVDHLPETCKVPSGWADFRQMFEHIGHAKSAETLLLAGDVGAYLLRHVDINPKIRALFIELFRLIERCHAHTHTDTH